MQFRVVTKEYLLFRSVCIFADNIPIFAECRYLFTISSNMIFEYKKKKTVNLVEVMRLLSLIKFDSIHTNTYNSAFAHTHIPIITYASNHTNLLSVIRFFNNWLRGSGAFIHTYCRLSLNSRNNKKNLQYNRTYIHIYIYVCFLRLDRNRRDVQVYQ